MALLGTVSAIAIAAPAAAQDDPSSTLQEVVVTGSLIKKPITEGSQLVTTVDSAQIERSGVASASEALRTLGQNQPLTVSATSAGLGTGFANYANLRSLGSSNTLVLFNGKRVVNNPYQSLGVDLNTIPINLIDRVETLSDGASSIYGSDAIAGVINFITKREVTGVVVSGTASEPEADGGGSTRAANISGGYGSLDEQGWNVYGGATYHRQEQLWMGAREFTATGYQPERGLNRLNSITFPANYNQSQTGLSAVNPTAPGCDPPLSLFANGAFGPRACALDNSPLNNAIPLSEDWSVFAKGTLKFGGEHYASLEYLRGEIDLLQQTSPQSVRAQNMTSNNPFYPGRGITPGATGLNPAFPISINWRSLDAGQTEIRNKTTTQRWVAQVEGKVAGLDYQVWGLRSTSDVHLIMTNGYLDASRLAAGLTGANGAPFLNPFGPQTAAGRQYILDSLILGKIQDARATLNMAGAQVNGKLWELPGGPIAFGVAADWKRETSRFINDPRLRTAIGSGFEGATDVSGSRRSYSGTAELFIPILPNFDIDVSLRYDHYSDFGSTTNPKVLATFRPTDWLTVHGSYNTGFRAPTLYNLNASVSFPISTIRNNDPVLCPGGVVNAAGGGVPTRDCNFQFQRQAGGNQDLTPEQSDAWSVGVIVRPLPRTSISLDYWDYHLKDTISTLSEAAIFANPSKYADLIVRCSSVSAAQIALFPACRIPGGDPIAYVVNTFLNLGDVKTKGVDLTFQWSSGEHDWGSVRVDYRGTYVFDFDFQREPGGIYFSRAGQYFDGSVVNDYTHYLTVTWEKDDWSAQVANRYQTSYTDCNAQCGITNNSFFNKVDPYSIFDVSATYSGFKNVRITGRILNLFDTDPPFTNKNSGLGSGYDERYTDPIGRAYSLTLRYEF